jgi:V/A-type H+-transporting ATPase subunit K
MLELVMKMSASLVLGIGSVGSAFGILAAATAAAGAWAAEGRTGKRLSFQYVIMVAAPISQTLYSMIVMNAILSKSAVAANAFLLLGTAVGVGVIEAASGYCQGRIGAAGIRCMVDSGGKGFGLLIIAIGIIETVGIFGMVFGLIIVNTATAAP